MVATDPFEEERIRAEQIAKQARFQDAPSVKTADRIGPVKNWADMHFAGMSAAEMRAADIERIAREKEEKYKARNVRILVHGGVLVVGVIAAVIAIKYLDLISVASRTSSYLFSHSAKDDTSTTDAGVSSSNTPQATVSTGPTQMDTATSKRVTWLEKDVASANDERENMQARIDKFTKKADELHRLISTLTREYDAAVAQGMKFTADETATHQQALDTANGELGLARGHIVDAQNTITSLLQRIDRDELEVKTIHQRYPDSKP